jgi:hypothetical protein
VIIRENREEERLMGTATSHHNKKISIKIIVTFKLG